MVTPFRLAAAAPAAAALAALGLLHPNPPACEDVPFMQAEMPPTLMPVARSASL